MDTESVNTLKPHKKGNTMPSKESAIDTIQKLRNAQALLVSAWEDTRATEIADAMDMISDYMQQYIQDNSQFGVGA